MRVMLFQASSMRGRSAFQHHTAGQTMLNDPVNRVFWLKSVNDVKIRKTNGTTTSATMITPAGVSSHKGVRLRRCLTAGTAFAVGCATLMMP